LWYAAGCRCLLLALVCRLSLRVVLQHPSSTEPPNPTMHAQYAMSVIVGRALPDVRDGLKPVHRRILYAMHDLGISPGKPYKKCARVVGEVRCCDGVGGGGWGWGWGWGWGGVRGLGVEGLGVQAAGAFKILLSLPIGWGGALSRSLQAGSGEVVGARLFNPLECNPNK